MLPELSRRIAKVMNTISINKMSLEKKYFFMNRLSNVENFEDLLDEDKKLILLAEKELKGEI